MLNPKDRQAPDTWEWNLKLSRSAPSFPSFLKSDDQFLSVYQHGVSRYVTERGLRPHLPQLPEETLAWRGLQQLIFRAFHELYTKKFPASGAGGAQLADVVVEAPQVTFMRNTIGPSLTCLVTARDSEGRYVAFEPGHAEEDVNMFFPGTIIRHPEAVKTRVQLSLSTEAVAITLLMSPHAFFEETKYIHKLSQPDGKDKSFTKTGRDPRTKPMPYIGKLIRQSIEEFRKPNPDQESDEQELATLNPVWLPTHDMTVLEITKPLEWESAARVVVDGELFSVKIKLCPHTYEVSAVAKRPLA